MNNEDDFLRELLAAAPQTEPSTRGWNAREVNNRIEDCNCPRCDAPMVMRMNRRNGEQFAGCSRYPACTGTRQVNNGEVQVDDNQPERPLSDRERIRQLEDEVTELKDKVAEIIHYYQEGEAA